MEEKPVTIKDSVTVIEEIQSKLEHMLTRRKADIERDLEERIRAEKAEADKKLEAIQKELDKGRGILEDYRLVVNEYETERTSLQGQIKEHFDKAVAFQTEIERMAGLTLEELRYVSDLTAKLDTIHVAAEEKVNGFRKDIEERFGIVAQLPRKPGGRGPQGRPRAGAGQAPQDQGASRSRARRADRGNAHVPGPGQGPGRRDVRAGGLGGG